MVGHICGNCHQSRDFNIIFYLDDYFLLEEHQSMLVTCHLSLLTLIWFNCDRRHMRAVSLDALGRVHPSASPTCCTGREGKEGRGQPASGGHCERRWGAAGQRGAASLRTDLLPSHLPNSRFQNTKRRNKTDVDKLGKLSPFSMPRLSKRTYEDQMNQM